MHPYYTYALDPKPDYQKILPLFDQAQAALRAIHEFDAYFGVGRYQSQQSGPRRTGFVQRGGEEDREGELRALLSKEPIGGCMDLLHDTIIVSDELKIHSNEIKKARLNHSIFTGSLKLKIMYSAL